MILNRSKYKDVIVFLFLMLSLMAYSKTKIGDTYLPDRYTRFKNITIQEGLSDNYVLTLLQDRYGIVWIGTKNGLNRYDGNVIYTFFYQPSKQNSLSNNFITCLTEDIYGNLWIGTQNGLNRYDRVSNTFQRFFQHPNKESLSNNYIKAIKADRNGFLWIETRSGFIDRYDIKKGQFKHVTYSTEDFSQELMYHQLFEDSFGTIRIAGKGTPPSLIQNLTLFEAQNAFPMDDPQDFIARWFFESPSKRLMALSNSKEIATYNPQKRKFEKWISLDFPFIPDIAIFDRNNRIWLGGVNSGIACISLSKLEKKLIKHYLHNEKSLLSDNINTILEDRNGNIWIGTDRGISIYSDLLNAFRYYQYIPNEKTLLSMNEITAMLTDRDGLIWIGYQNGQLDTFSLNNEQLGHVIDATRFIREKSTSSTLSSKKQFQIETTNEQSPISRLYQSQDGKIWIGKKNFNEIYVYDKKIHSLKQVAPPEKLTFGILRHIKESNKSNEMITGFADAKNGRIWIAKNQDEGLRLYDYQHAMWIPTHFSPQHKPKETIMSFAMDRPMNRLWMCSRGYFGYYQFSDSSFHRVASLKYNQWDFDPNLMIAFNGKKVKNSSLPLNLSFYSLLVDKNHQVWINTSLGLMQFDPAGKKLTFSVDPQNLFVKDSVSAMGLTPNGAMLWLATPKGIYRFNVDEKKSLTPKWMFGMKGVTSIVPDASQHLWLVSNQTLLQTDTIGNHFFVVNESGFKNKKKPTGIKVVRFNGLNQLWIGCDEGIIVLENGREIKRYPFGFHATGNVPGTLIHDIQFDRHNNTWVSTNAGLLFIPFSKHHSSIVYQADNRLPDQLLCNTTYALGIDLHNYVWISTNKGLSRFDPNNKRFVDLNDPDSRSLSSNHISCILKDQHDRLWIGTTDAGVNVLDPKTTKIEHYEYRLWNKYGLLGNQINCIFEDHSGTIWIGTFRGLNQFIPSTKQFKNFTVQDGLPSNDIRSIQEDSKHRLWISTANALSCFDPSSKRTNTFSHDQGLIDNEFNNISGRLPNGHLVFGGTSGFNVFDPDKVCQNEYSNISVLFSNFYIQDTLRYFDLNPFKQILLNYRNNDFMVTFGATEYIFGKNIHYRYLLKGYDKHWKQINGTFPIAFYSNIPPGEYQLLVEMTNSSGQWTNVIHSLNIKILTPFYRQRWFYALVLIFIIITVILFFKWREKNLIETKNKLEKIILDRTSTLLELNEQLNDSKTILQNELAVKEKFFSIISHDLKNPSYSLRQLSELLYQHLGQLDKEKIEKITKLIFETAQQNHKLTEDLLHLALVQRKKFTPHFSEINLTDIISNVIKTVNAEAQLKEISIETSLSHHSKLTVDPQMIDMVLRNLLSNAIKFSYHGQQIILKTEENETDITISVIDRGIGMTSVELQKLMTYETTLHKDGTQGEKGSGLGLLLCKEIIDLHHGKISIESTKNVGTTIIFALPKNISPSTTLY